MCLHASKGAPACIEKEPSARCFPHSHLQLLCCEVSVRILSCLLHLRPIFTLFVLVLLLLLLLFSTPCIILWARVQMSCAVGREKHNGSMMGHMGGMHATRHTTHSTPMGRFSASHGQCQTEMNSLNPFQQATHTNIHLIQLHTLIRD